MRECAAVIAFVIAGYCASGNENAVKPSIEEVQRFSHGPTSDDGSGIYTAPPHSRVFWVTLYFSEFDGPRLVGKRKLFIRAHETLVEAMCRRQHHPDAYSYDSIRNDASASCIRRIVTDVPQGLAKGLRALHRAQKAGSFPRHPGASHSEALHYHHYHKSQQ